MYQALLNRNREYEGIFVVGVRTTGIFCRPACSARKPKREHVEFFAGVEQAQAAGYRACKVCQPTRAQGYEPAWLQPILAAVSAGRRLRDTDIRDSGVEPARVRRWFKANYGKTFQAWQRDQLIAAAHSRLRRSEGVTDTAFDSGFESLSGFSDAFHRLAGFTPSKSRCHKLLLVRRLLTPLGPMFAVADDDGLCLLEFADRKRLEQQLLRVQRRLNAQFVSGDHELLQATEIQLMEYFAGKRRQFDVRLQLLGTQFQRQCWQALQAIPYGQTCSYLEQASALGAPSAVRAVANANGQNSLAIILPCHRVVGKDGRLTGYAGGLWRKQRLLDLELGAA